MYIQPTVLQKSGTIMVNPAMVKVCSWAGFELGLRQW